MNHSFLPLFLFIYKPFATPTTALCYNGWQQSVLATNICWYVSCCF